MSLHWTCSQTAREKDLEDLETQFLEGYYEEQENEHQYGEEYEELTQESIQEPEPQNEMPLFTFLVKLCTKSFLNLRNSNEVENSVSLSCWNFEGFQSLLLGIVVDGRKWQIHLG